MDPHPRDKGIDSVVPLVVFRVHTLAHLQHVSTALMYAAETSLHIFMHVQFAPGEWDPRRVAKLVEGLIISYELDDAAPFWTPTWFDNGHVREHLHNHKLYFTVTDQLRPTTTDGKRKQDAMDINTADWKIYAEGFVVDAILKHANTEFLEALRDPTRQTETI